VGEGESHPPPAFPPPRPGACAQIRATLPVLIGSIALLNIRLAAMPEPCFVECHIQIDVVLFAKRDEFNQLGYQFIIKVNHCDLRHGRFPYS
jgi:hypothetical protein